MKISTFLCCSQQILFLQGMQLHARKTVRRDVYEGKRFLTYIIRWFIIVLGTAQLFCVYPRHQVGRMCKPPGMLMLKKISFALFYPFCRMGFWRFFFTWQKSDASWLDAILLGQNFPGLEEMVLGEGREYLKAWTSSSRNTSCNGKYVYPKWSPLPPKNNTWQFSLIQTPFFKKQQNHHTTPFLPVFFHQKIPLIFPLLKKVTISGRNSAAGRQRLKKKKSPQFGATSFASDGSLHSSEVSGFSLMLGLCVRGFTKRKRAGLLVVQGKKRGWNITQSCGDYVINHEIRIPTNQ